MHDRGPQANTESTKQLTRIADALERLIRLWDERVAAELNSKYPHGRPTDRWRRSA
jgi:hypothetical protein